MIDAIAQVQERHTVKEVISRMNECYPCIRQQKSSERASVLIWERKVPLRFTTKSRTFTRSLRSNQATLVSLVSVSSEGGDRKAFACVFEQNQRDGRVACVRWFNKIVRWTRWCRCFWLIRLQVHNTETRVMHTRWRLDGWAPRWSPRACITAQVT